MDKTETFESTSPNRWLGPLAVGMYFASATLLLHFAFNGGYGYFRDELYFMACGEHLAWGYPDHAPMVALMAKMSRALLGDSLFAIRFFPAVAGAAKVFLTALLVREFAGERSAGRSFAAFLACLCVLCAPVYLAIDNLLGMNALEPVFWMLCVYFAVLAVKREEPRYWLWLGVFAGLGLMNKHSMVFFGVALVAGVLLTKARKVFLNRWFWIGGLIAFLIFLPNIIWEQQNNWATLELLQNVQKSGKNVVLSPLEFIWQQIFMLGPPAALVWGAGIWYFLAGKNGKRFRFLGICYLVLLVLMIFLKAKNYYLAPIYPMLFAAGAVWWQEITERIRVLRFAKPALPLLILAFTAVALPMVLPVLPVEKLISYQEAVGFKPPKSEVSHEGVLQQVYADQFGWEEMVEKVAAYYNSLPPEEREKTAIYGNNYGQAGAIDFFGGKYGLPKSISPHQSYFLWGPRNYTGESVIVLGDSLEGVREDCRSAEVVGEVTHPYTLSYEKYSIIHCHDTKKPLPEIWPGLKYWN
jgi:hypothetical protein